MVNGRVKIGPMPNFEDYKSLKLHLRKLYKTTYSSFNRSRCLFNQAGTNTAVDLEEKAGQTIVEIGKAELTIVLASDTDDNAYDTESVTIHYLDADGVSHEASATYNSANSTTEVAFTDAATGLVAVTDFYCWDPDYGALAVVSTVAAQAGDNICIGKTGCVAGIANPETCVAIIEAGDTSPDLDNMHGVGNIWGKTEANHNDGDGMILTLDYITPWGEVVENATCTIDTTDGTTEVRFIKSSGIYAQDFYRVRSIDINTTPTSNTHSVFITTYNGDAVYGAIEEGNTQWISSRYMCPVSRDAWVARICIGQSIATNLDCYMTITFTPYGSTTEISCQVAIPNNGAITIEPLLRLNAATDIRFQIKGNLSDVSADIEIVEAVQVS